MPRLHYWGAAYLECCPAHYVVIEVQGQQLPAKTQPCARHGDRKVELGSIRGYPGIYKATQERGREHSKDRTDIIAEEDGCRLDTCFHVIAAILASVYGIIVDRPADRRV